MQKLYTIKYNIVSSGSVFMVDENPLIITFSDNEMLGDGTEFVLNVNFTELEEKGQIIEVESVKNNDETKPSFNVFVYNAKNTPGGTPEPLVIAENTQTQKKILMSISFQGFEKSRLINYTFFVEK